MEAIANIRSAAERIGSICGSQLVMARAIFWKGATEHG